jgi:hypothetical protein
VYGYVAASCTFVSFVVQLFLLLFKTRAMDVLSSGLIDNDHSFSFCPFLDGGMFHSEVLYYRMVDNIIIRARQLPCQILGDFSDVWLLNHEAGRWHIW